MNESFDFTEVHDLPARTYRERGPKKSRLVYILLALFLGLFGIHNFYAGRIGTGVVQLVLSLLILTAPLTLLWVIIEIATVEKDGRGRYLK